MTLETYRLKELMTLLSKNEISSMLSDFTCSRNKDSENFLRNISLRHEKKDISRTYLTINLDEERILGYATLALKCLSLNETNLDPDIVRSMNLNEGVAQAYLLGQLARADDATPGLGKTMLDEALKVFSLGKKKFGCRMARLDCKDELVGYYESYGFLHIRKDQKKDLNQMVIFM